VNRSSGPDSGPAGSVRWRLISRTGDPLEFFPGKEREQVPEKGKVHLIGLMGREAYGKGSGLRAVVHAQLGEHG
jgi:hypothetical protein